MFFLILLSVASIEGSLFVKSISKKSVVLPKLVPLRDEPWEDNYILISNSSATSTPPPSSPPPEFNKPEPDCFPRVRRRRRKKKPGEVINHKDAKFLNLFTIVRFQNGDCSINGGTCYTAPECEGLGGRVEGTCAKGFGVCCIVEAACGSRGEINGAVFTGGSSSGVCILTVEKSSCTKQLRLDFINLELDSPVDGNCVTERLLVTGHNRNSILPVICGSNTGQHVYVDVDNVPGPIMVSVISPTRKEFRIKVTQLCDGNELLAPKHCLQYFTEETGYIQSFNYAPSENSSYLNNLNYAICIRKGGEKCSIVYDGGDENGFEINNVDSEGELTVPPGQAGAEVFNCPEDYITIASVRLCGQRLNDATTELDFTKSYPITDSSSGPFYVSFKTNDAVTGRGFRLKYQQMNC